MTPDIEELIKKVNSLTLDKNRLKQKLNQLNQNGNQHQLIRGDSINNSIQTPSLSTSQSSNQLQNQCSSDCDPSLKITKNSKSSGDSFSSSKSSNSTNHVIAGVECSTSCEDDLLYMNELYRRRLEDYDEKWEYIQSKCTALLSELNALQKQYVCLKKEKLEIEELLKSKCDDNDSIQNELQTVVLNYEAQLSAMSEHLSMITNQVNLGDNLNLIAQ